MYYDCYRWSLQDPNILAKDTVAQTAFLEMDSNEDGVVTMDEFLEACLGQSELCQLLALKAVEIFAEWADDRAREVFGRLIL